MDANSLKRLVVAALSAAAVFINKKFGFALGEAEIAAIAGIVITYLAQSAVVQKAKLAGESAAAEVADANKAAEVLGGKVVP